jgi:hypothetical protein
MKKEGSDQLPRVLVSGNGVEVPGNPEVNIVISPVKRKKNDPIGKNKTGSSPWKMF